MAAAVRRSFSEGGPASASCRIRIRVPFHRIRIANRARRSRSVPGGSRAFRTRQRCARPHAICSVAARARVGPGCLVRLRGRLRGGELAAPSRSRTRGSRTARHRRAGHQWEPGSRVHRKRRSRITCGSDPRHARYRRVADAERRERRAAGCRRTNDGATTGRSRAASRPLDACRRARGAGRTGRRRDAAHACATVARGAHTVRVARDGYVADERRVVVSAASPAQSLTMALARARRAGEAPSTPSRARSVDGRAQRRVAAGRRERVPGRKADWHGLRSRCARSQRATTTCGWSSTAIGAGLRPSTLWPVSAVASPRRWTGDVIAITARGRRAVGFSECDHGHLQLT